MKITSIRLQPEDTSDPLKIDLSFKDPRRTKPYNVKAVYGLDADNIGYNSVGFVGSGYQNVDNSNIKTFYDSAMKERVIIVRIELNPDFSSGQTYSDLRDDLYRMIASTRRSLLNVLFYNNLNQVASVSGFITKLEAPHFTETPEVQLTINCIDPIIKGAEEISVPVGSLDPANTEVNDYLSTAPHGFKMALTVGGDTDVIKIRGEDALGWQFVISAASDDFELGDVVHISSVHNNKYIYRTRTSLPGEIHHLADLITIDSVWPIMYPGKNIFVCTTESPVTTLTWELISYWPAYWGI